MFCGGSSRVLAAGVFGFSKGWFPCLCFLPVTCGEARICRKASAVFGLVSCCGIPKVTDVKVFLLYLHLQEMSLGHSSICGASDTLLAGSAGVQKVEDVFFPSCSRCTWHHTGVSLLSDLLVVFFWGECLYFYLEPSQNAQVRFTRVGARRLQPVLVAGVLEQCNHSLPAPGKGLLTGTFPGRAVPGEPEMAQHSCCTSVGWTEHTCRVWEGGLGRTFASSGFSFPQLPPSCCCFGLFHREFWVLPLCSFIVWWYLRVKFWFYLTSWDIGLRSWASKYYLYSGTNEVF